MRELRPHFTDAEVFVAQVIRQQEQRGYRLAYVDAGGEVRSVAGYREGENLSAGRFVYVDDLVTREEDHGSGYGSLLFDWMVTQARETGCAGFYLDSGVQRFGAHRFYLGKGMDILAHHFGMKL